MKKQLLSIINLVLIITILATGVTLYFLKFKSTNRLAYVNISVLINDFGGMKQSRADFENQKKIWQANVDTLFVELQKGIQQHEQGMNQMSEKEKQLSQELLERKRQEYFQYKQAMEQKAGEEDQRLTAKVYEEVNAFVQEYGKNNNYKIILGANGSGNIMYAQEGMDITQQVLKELNARYGMQ